MSISVSTICRAAILAVAFLALPTYGAAPLDEPQKPVDVTKTSDPHEIATTLTLGSVKQGQKELIVWFAGGESDSDFKAVLQPVRIEGNELVTYGAPIVIETKPQHDARKYHGHRGVHHLTIKSGLRSLKFFRGDTLLSEVFVRP